MARCVAIVPKSLQFECQTWISRDSLEDSGIRLPRLGQRVPVELTMKLFSSDSFFSRRSATAMRPADMGMAPLLPGEDSSTMGQASPRSVASVLAGCFAMTHCARELRALNFFGNSAGRELVLRAREIRRRDFRMC